MPLTPQTADLISQGANGIFGIVGDLMSRKYNQRMYEKQRGDALADWNMQNQYNSPAAQMERLKSAGLNPNLVYGDGGATMASAPIRQSQTQDWRPSEKKIDLGSNAMMGYDIKLKQAQLKNLETANAVGSMDVQLRDAQIKATLANAGLTSWKEESGRGKYLPELQQIQNRNENILANTSFTKQQQQINQKLADQNLSKGLLEMVNLRTTNAKTRQEINNMQGALELMGKEGVLKDLDALLKLYEVKLNKKGVTKGDNPLIRNAQDIFLGLGFQPPSVVKENLKRLILKFASQHRGGGN